MPAYGEGIPDDWIETVPFAFAGETLREALLEQRKRCPPEYALRVRGRPGDVDAGIVAAHSPIPEGLRHAFATFAAGKAPEPPAMRRRHEIIVVSLSATNRTRYCTASRLREAGFADTAILQITMIAAWCSYVNRIADGLGIVHD